QPSGVSAMENPRCPRCGTELSAGSPEKLCPRCLLLAGLESQGKPVSPPTSAYSPGFAAPTPEELGRFFPQLEILELLGKGGMGAVYKARQPGLDRLVALKILPLDAGSDPAFSERFTREARALAKLNHANIVGVFDFGQTNGLYYFLMEYVDGVNLRQAMRAGNLMAEEALKIVPQICEALQFVHDEGVVHRDIKPENILLDKRGRVKIADFGLAKMLRTKVDRGLTGTHQIMGTPHYMAPEQIQGTRDVDHRADIYSLGVTFYEMLTGELPLGRFAPPSTKAHIDVRLDEVVLRTLEVEPEKRYQHASDVKTRVEEIGGVTAGALLRAFGKEYRSKTTIFGVPLLHIAFGFDPRTGRKRMARGIFAFGDIALGAVAFGGLAMGGVCFGGLSLGLVSMAGLALGLVGAFGGVAIGTFAFGGLAVGGVAMGGMAVGYYAYGGGGWAVHAMVGGHADPEAMAFFHPWAHQWGQWMVRMSLGYPILLGLIYAFIWFVFRFVAPANVARADQRTPRRLF
ncbi:MAG TPA: serine/threonine-protein kinase, partial [Gemmataceae bacterium]|nr:serine/threonine-protein kinase [Gemmataceae bacterium]